MRAIVYGVMAGLSSWRWCVSVALQADAFWWGKRGVERVWIAGDGTYSLGQAFARRKQLEAAGAGGPAGDGRWASWRGAAGDEWEADLSLYERMLRAWEGRLLLPEEVESLLAFEDIGRFDAGQWLPYVQLGALDGRLRLHNGLRREPLSWADRWRERFAERSASRSWSGYRCVRCGSGGGSLHETHCPVCRELCPYCEACLTMGRVRYCSLLIQGVRRGAEVVRPGTAGCLRTGGRADAEHAVQPGSPSRPDTDPEGAARRWGLSPAQAEAALAALRFLDEEQGKVFLLWAVTGAGKTEMMFPLIEHVLSRGGRALVATPRKDVVLELEPRCRAAFPASAVVAWYGGSEQRWKTGHIALSTTHQLFRYREAFDLVVLDEVDAFPFHGNPQLAFAAERACAPHGKFVLLSATPPRQLRKLAERGRLPHAKVCVRFHRHPLPVPLRLAVSPMRRWVERGLPRSLRMALERSLLRGAQLFVFVSRIAWIAPLVRLLVAAFPGVPVDGASSQDEARGEKVTMFRDRHLRIIVTTTILERGVTVPKTDVFVLEADSPLFDGASLVQMAGRAGRKSDDPQGNVWFCSAEWTAGQREAVRDIRSMNALARRKGYLIEG